MSEAGLLQLCVSDDSVEVPAATGYNHSTHGDIEESRTLDGACDSSGRDGARRFGLGNSHARRKNKRSVGAYPFMPRLAGGNR